MIAQRGSTPVPNAAALGDLFASYGKQHDKEPSKFSQLSEPAQKAVKEKETLLRHYKAHLREERERMLENGGGALRSIVGFLDKAGPDDAAAIVETFRQYVSACDDADIRQFLMRMVGRACMRIREQCGLDALDDPLPDTMLESPRPLPVFHRCREIMNDIETGERNERDNANRRNQDRESAERLPEGRSAPMGLQPG